MFAPPGPVELHRFRGRLFVTGEWGGDWGVAVPDGASAADVGALLHRGLEGERARRAPLLEPLRSFRRRLRSEERGWEHFCTRVAGVEVAEYRPEVRMEVYEDDEERALRIRPIQGGPVDPEQDVRLPLDAGAQELGDAMLGLLDSTPPAWPAVRRAQVHVASRRRLVVFPVNFRYGAPVRVAAVDDPPDAIGALVLLTLADSERVDPNGPIELWERALADAGLSEAQIARRRAVAVDELADGSVCVEALRPATGGGWESAGELGVLALSGADDVTLGRAVVAAGVTWDPWAGRRIEL